MAGIGFILRRVVAEDTYTSIFKGYIAAAIVAAGPWIISVLTLSVLGALTASYLPNEQRNLFFAAVVYAFGFSLISTGFVVMPATRMAADLIYLQREDVIPAAAAGILIVVLPMQAASMALFFALSGVELGYALAVGWMYAALSGVWILLVFISGARKYGPVLQAFAIAFALSLICSFVLGRMFGPVAGMYGFAIGQTSLLILIWARVLKEFGPFQRFSFLAFEYVRKFPSLAAIGFMYSGGLWIANFVFWWSPLGIAVTGSIHVFPLYDIATYISFMSAAPAMAFFLIQVETNFYDQYREFYSIIAAKGSLPEILSAKRRLGRAITSNFVSLLRFQFLVTLIWIFAGPKMLELMGLPYVHAYALRQLTIAAGLHVLFSTAMLLLLYFDMRRSVLIATCVFVSVNLAATVVTVQAGFEWHGLGLVVAECAALSVAGFVFVNRFRRLEYLTFTRQPITGPEREASMTPASRLLGVPEGQGKASPAAGAVHPIGAPPAGTGRAVVRS